MAGSPFRVEQRGLGWAVVWPNQNVVLRFDAVKQSRDSLYADLSVTMGAGAGPEGHVKWSRENLTSSRTRDMLAKSLSLTNGDVRWGDVLERSFVAIVGVVRQGEPEEFVQPEAHTAPTILMLVDPLAPEGQATVLFGPGGSSKSYVATALAASVASGREVVPGMTPRTSGPVLYADWETDRDTFARRLSRVAAGAGLGGQIGVYYRRCRRPLGDDVEPIAEIIARRGVILIIVDSVEMASGAGGEWSDANDRALRMFGALRLLGVTSILVDHVSKAELDRTRRYGMSPYGSIFKGNLARSVWELRRSEELSWGPNIIRVGHHQRWMASCTMAFWRNVPRAKRMTISCPCFLWKFSSAQMRTMARA